MIREEGYYWVKDPQIHSWFVAEWDGDEWWICGAEYGFQEEWEEIGYKIPYPETNERLVKQISSLKGQIEELRSEITVLKALKGGN